MTKKTVLYPVVGALALSFTLAALTMVHTPAGGAALKRMHAEADIALNRVEGASGEKLLGIKAWAFWKIKAYEKSIAAYHAALAAKPLPWRQNELASAMVSLRIPEGAPNDVALKIARLRDEARSVLPSNQRAAYRELGDTYVALGQFAWAAEAYGYAAGAVRKTTGKQKQLLDQSAARLITAVDELLARGATSPDAVALWKVRADANRVRGDYATAEKDDAQVERLQASVPSPAHTQPTTTSKRAKRS